MNIRALADPPARSSLRDRLEKNVADLNRMRNELEQAQANLLVLQMLLRDISYRAKCGLMLAPDYDRFALLGIQQLAQRGMQQ